MIKENFIMFINLKFIFSLFKYLIFLTSISIFLLSCDSNNNEYTGPWKEVPTPGGEGELRACYFTSSDNGWACGWTWNDAEQKSYPLLIHWNGTEWEEYPYGGWFDEEGFIATGIFDISFSGLNDGWCVGELLDKQSEHHGFILRYDGSKWYSFNKDLGVQVWRVYAISSNDVWFVVYDKGNGDFLYHWDGNEIKKSDTSPVDAGIECLAFSSSNEGLAVGWYYCVYHWDGTSWTEIDVDPSRPYPYHAVSYYEPKSALIIGPDRRARWRNGEYQYEYKFHANYDDIHFSHPDEGWMIGAEHYNGHIWHWDGKDWTVWEVTHEMWYNAVFSVDYNDAWMVGNNDYGNCATWHYEPEK
jgi:hypothetical protein